jgi:acyl-CoA synthetase (AMP-forming)/AMP-acid ligase II
MSDHKIPEAVREQWKSLTPDGGLTLGDLALKIDASRPDSWLVCVSATGETRLSHAEFIAQASRIAGGLSALGAGRGDVVAVQLPASLEAVLAHAACALIGATLLPVIHIYGVHELQFVLKESGTKILITSAYFKDQNLREKVAGLSDLHALQHHITVGAPDGGACWQDLLASEPIGAVDRGVPQDIALLMYTSGTTSSPKGVQHSHAGISADLSLGIGEYVTADGPILCPWPPGHIAGFLVLARFWAKGFNTILMEYWDGALAARLIDEYKVVLSQGTPFHLNAVLDAAERDGRDLSSIQEFVAGATIVSPALVNRSTAAGIVMLRSYGLTECPSATRGTRHDPLEKRLFTDGRATPGVKIRIVDDFGVDVPNGEPGEVILCAVKEFVGYRRAELNADVFLPGGWMRTGDIGVMDDEGYLSITDRKKDIIIRGGENISSREVEELVAMLAGVREVAAVGMPDERLGERVCVFVSLQENASLTLEDIDRFLQGKGVARQKTPERLVLVDDFPRTPSGKIKKNELRQHSSIVKADA